MKKAFYCFSFSIFCFLWLIFPLQCQEQEHQALEYNVSVIARLVPVFAINKNGTPVHDLKKDEIIFSLNGKECPFEFARFQFDNREEIEVKQKKDLSKTDPQNRSKTSAINRRVIFIVIDSTLNSKGGIKISKEIAKRLIRTKFMGDEFVILESMAGGSLKYITGPGNDENKLLSALKTVSDFPEKFEKNLLLPTTEKKDIPGSVDLSEKTNEYNIMSSHIVHRLKKNLYRMAAKQSTISLKQLKYALKTISDPKIVFLISEGVQKGALFNEYTHPITGEIITYLSCENFNYLSDVARAINDGGSILYTINPKKVEYESMRSNHTSGDGSLKYMAKESGGQYFEGTNPEVIVKQIRETTAAYYELAFMLKPGMNKAQELKLECRRPGVKLHSIKHVAAEKPYIRMTQVEKKIFALNVVHQGAWSQIVAKSDIGSFKEVKSEKKSGHVIKTYEVEIPEEMKNKKVDIFVIRLGKAEDKIDFGMQRKKAGNIEHLKLELKKNRRHYYVIIDPEKPYCIYNKLSQ